MSETVKRILIILSSSFLFALAWTSARGAYLDGANDVFIIFLTTFFRLVVLIGLCFYQGFKLFEQYSDWKIGFQSGFIQAISIFGILGSMVYLPPPVAIVILFTSTIMLLFFQWFKKEIEVNKWLFVTTVLCLLGITLVVDVWNIDPNAEMIGYILISIGAIASASRLYMFSQMVKNKPPPVVGAETFIFASLFLILLLFYDLPHGPQTIEGYGWALLSAVSGSIATLFMFYGIKKAGAFHYSLYSKLEPVFGSILSAILISEILKTSQYIGMMIVIASLVFYQIWDYRRKLKML